MGTYSAGPLHGYTPTNAGIINPDIYGISINFFPNRHVLWSRFPHTPTGASHFKITVNKYRPGSTTMNQGAALANNGTSLTLTDGTPFVVGDVIQIESELILITAVSGNTVTISRGYAGTTAAAHNDTLTVYLVGNAATGNEVDRDGKTWTPAVVDQYTQVFQHVYQVGGSIQAQNNYTLPPGVANPLGEQKMLCLQNVLDDIERSSFYGVAAAASGTTGAGGRQMMAGLRALITSNKTTSPTNSGAYKPSDLIRDTLQKCRAGGGQPDLLIVSTEYMSGLATWNMPLVRLDAGATEMGVDVDMFECPFLNGVTIVEHPLLRPFTAVALTSSELKYRVLRAPYDKPRGSRGDADEGDIIAECAIELDNEAHHAWVEGVTSFSAS